MQLRQVLLQRRYRRGFTFIEIGLALAVIAVLVAIALPSYSRYKERVKLAQAVIDIANLQSLIVQYYYNNQAYPDSLADIGQAGMRDPWGNPYQYANLSDSKAKPRKNRNVHPINSDFDLYSMGKDGRSNIPLTAQASRDDIVRANDGRFIGLVSEYDP
jgi:general secretion pathway protein G